MSETFVWYSFEEFWPKDKDWVLVADDRFETPKKALFKNDCGCNYLTYDDKRTREESYGEYRLFEHAYAWMPIPPMPTREQIEKGVWRG